MAELPGPAPRVASYAEFQDLSADEQRRLVNDKIVPKGDAALATIWKWLLGGLFALAALAVIGTIILASNGKTTAATPMMILATSVVTGTIGLFSSSPVETK